MNLFSSGAVIPGGTPEITGDEAVEGLRTTLVTRDIDTPYSGMLPGYVEGIWKSDDIHIDRPGLPAWRARVSSMRPLPISMPMQIC